MQSRFLVESDSIAKAWAKVVRELLKPGVTALSPAIVEIKPSNDETTGEVEFRDAVDEVA